MIWFFLAGLTLLGLGYLAWQFITAPDDAPFIEHENDLDAFDYENPCHY